MGEEDMSDVTAQPQGKRYPMYDKCPKCGAIALKPFLESGWKIREFVCGSRFCEQRDTPDFFEEHIGCLHNQLTQRDEELADAKEENKGLLQRNEFLENEVRRAGTPYAKDVDSRNALIIENKRLRKVVRKGLNIAVKIDEYVELFNNSTAYFDPRGIITTLKKFAVSFRKALTAGRDGG